MEDIVPQLLERITEDFQKSYNSSSKIRLLLKKVREETATYKEAQEYSLEVSRLIGMAYERHISGQDLPDGQMYYNIASRLIPSALDENYKLVSEYAAKVQKALNQKAKIGLKEQVPEINASRVEGLVEMVSGAEQYDEVAGKLTTAFENFSQNIVDESIKANVEFQGKAGMKPKVIRKAERKCCKWCSSLAGEYDYPDVPNDVYRRHENCRCQVDYDPGSGKRQNVHTKQWKSAIDYDKIEARKQIGLKDAFIKSLSTHPKRLASLTPNSIKAKLEAEGYEIKPLKNGSLKNIPFEEGGGYKVNFADGGLFQYHPASRSHHGGAYYKISTGEGGTHRYDLEGNEIDG